MECPHCNMEIEGMACDQCGVSIPKASRYCMECGAQQEKADSDDFKDSDDGFSMEDRVLCIDGTCTGIIIDGKCVECGKGPEGAEESKEE